MIFRKSVIGSNYPNVSITNANHNQGVERLYLRCRIFTSCVDHASHRDREYADYDLFLCAREWGRKFHR